MDTAQISLKPLSWLDRTTGFGIPGTVSERSPLYAETSAVDARRTFRLQGRRLTLPARPEYATLRVSERPPFRS